MSKLVPPHGGKGLVCCLLEGKALEDELQKAKGLTVDGVCGKNTWTALLTA